MKRLQIAPSILAADFGRLSDEAKRAEDSGADMIHLDVMDGHFVPNLTFGPQVVEAVKKSVNIPLDVHLMIARPDVYSEVFINAGADYLTVHAEAQHNLTKTLQLIKKYKIKAGLALNPDKEIETIQDVLHDSDIVLVMSVFPGFGGQKFIKDVLKKVETLAELRRKKGYSYKIEIDGGINLDTCLLARKAGVDIAVAGTFLFGSADMKDLISKMKALN